MVSIWHYAEPMILIYCYAMQTNKYNENCMETVWKLAYGRFERQDHAWERLCESECAIAISNWSTTLVMYFRVCFNEAIDKWSACDLSTIRSCQWGKSWQWSEENELSGKDATCGKGELAPLRYQSCLFCLEHDLMIATWLILPVVIRSSQRLSHACLSINLLLWNCEWLIISVIVYLIVPYYLDNRSNSRANTCINTQLFADG